MRLRAVIAVLAIGGILQTVNAAEPPATYGDAMRWYERQAEAGVAKAQFLLGRMYERGAAGRPRDPEKAAELYRAAAGQGYALAQFSLGLMYLQGRGVERDPEQAAHWFGKAAEQGVPEAQFNLGYLYDRGMGVPADRDAALRWYRAAARQGVTRAQFNLGMLLTTLGPPDRDALIEAWAWFRLAAEDGHRTAADMAADLAERLSPAEMERARAALEARRRETGQ